MESLLIGLGGIGTGVVRRVKKALLDNPAYKDMVEKEVFFCSLDVDPSYDAEICYVDQVRDFKVAKPLEVINNYKDDRDFKSWWIPGYKTSIPIEGKHGSGQIRINGRLAFFANYEKIAKVLKDKIDKVKQLNIKVDKNTGSSKEPNVHIFIVSTLAGGTGSGILIDTAALLRSITVPGDMIYGVLFDGSVVTRITDTNTDLYGYAALTEIERWQEKPNEFVFKYLGGRVQITQDRFFDIVFLIQAKNMDGKTFYGTDQDIKKNYQLLAASFLENVVSTTKVEELTAANAWNRYEMMPAVIETRSCKYSSFAISHISYPAEKVTNYCFARLMCEKLKDGFSIVKPDLYILERDIGICEHDGNQLTNILRKSPSAATFLSRAENVIRAFTEEVGNREKFNEKIDEYELINFSEWDKLLTKYKTEMKNELANLEQKTKIIIEEKFINLIASLKFGDLKNTLNEFKGAMEDNKKHITTDKRFWDKRDHLRKQLRNNYDEVLNCKQGFLGMGNEFPSKKQRFIETFKNWFLSELEAIEHSMMADFYDNMLKYLNNFIWTIDFLGKIFNQYVDEHAKMLGAYIQKDWIVSPEKFMAEEYLLNMEISTSKKDVDENVYVKVEKLVDDTLMNEIRDGKENAFIGLKELFTKLYNQYMEDPVRMASKIRSKEEEFRKNIEEIFEKAIKSKIREEIKRIRIDDALEWFLEKTYNEVTGAMHSKTEMEKLRVRFNFIFGDAAAESLLTRIGNFDDWCSEAIKALIYRVDTLTKPFVSVDETRVRKLWEKEDPEFIKTIKIKTLFIPTGFKFRNAVPDLKCFETHNEQQITFYTQFNYFPLHCLTGFSELERIYLDHKIKINQRISEAKAPGIPAHADYRFYKEDMWSDSIVRESAPKEDIERDALYLFLMGLGLSYIRRDRQQFKIFNQDGVFQIGVAGLEKIYQVLQDDRTLQSGLAKVIHTKFVNEYYPKIEKTQEIFKTAYESLKEIKLGPKQPSFGLWQKILELSKFDLDGKPKHKDFIPDSESGIEDLKNRLERMKSKGT